MAALNWAVYKPAQILFFSASAMGVSYKFFSFLVILDFVPSRAVAEYDSITQCAAAYPGLESLSLAQCQRQCFSGWKPYGKWDVVTSVVAFVLPLFILIGNMHFTRFGAATVQGEAHCLGEKGIVIALKCAGVILHRFSSFVLDYFSVLCHVLGDPIDTIWSLSVKLDVPRRYKQWAEQHLSCLSEIDRQAITVILATFDDFEFGKVDGKNLADLIFIQVEAGGADGAAFLKTCRQASVLLRQTRVQNARRSFLAIVSYAASLFITLDSNRGLEQTPVHTPHTVALRELYYWLIPAITLSAANGAFPTAETSYVILRPILDYMKRKGTLRTLPQPLKLYSGGSYVWRPFKDLSHISGSRSIGFSCITLLHLAFMSIASAWIMSFLMSWYTPTTGLGCRSITELSYFLVWLLSCAMTAILSRMVKGYFTLFMAIFVKDMFFAVPMVTVLFAAFKGM
ncbi:MAG: hypothetical protein Q9157_003028 [Trypethelium eluteriae]